MTTAYTTKKIIAGILSLSVIFASSLTLVPVTHAATLTNLSILPSNGLPSATGASYVVGFTPSATAIQCIQVKFATDASMATAATGMTSGTGVGFTGVAGTWTNIGTTNGTLKATTTSGQVPGAIVGTWTGVTNPSITNPANVYAQISTFSDASCTTGVDQSSVLAILYTSGVSVSLNVPSTLSFTVADYGLTVNGSGTTGMVSSTSTAIPFGTVPAGVAALASQTLTPAVNSAHGYTDYMQYSNQLTDGAVDLLADQTGSSTTPAAFSGTNSTSAFGYTEDHTSQSQFATNTWAPLTTTQTAIATKSTGTAGDTFHVAYKVMPSNTQAP